MESLIGEHGVGVRFKNILFNNNLLGKTKANFHGECWRLMLILILNLKERV